MATKKQKSVKLVPKLRFPEFESADPWQPLLGNKLFDQINNRDHDGKLPILAITQEHGAIPRDKIDYHVSATSQSVKSYKVVNKGDFIISLRSFQGGIEYSEYTGICSPAYVILRESKGSNIIFLKAYLKTTFFIKELTKNSEGLRDGKMISFKQFSEVSINLPNDTEQQKIANCFESPDTLIEAQISKTTSLQAQKKASCSSSSLTLRR